ncbi:hypothetical protein QA612_13945 [Evansella sp. AB-P1]|uniref:hypothetical protein n=1 Tax=Evansella sp. AB-P1 TaxID=3037653 RepID=UPI00241D2C4F|nr:hypothetical protein [Evansella sp. AB-P1]MDG5788584.1 hypothetical protein [Evansella sp. AB-P1]
MKIKLNVISFILTILCIMLFILYLSIDLLGTNLLGVHPLYIILTLTVLTFILAVFGSMGANSWQSILRTTLSIVLTLSLSGVLSYIIFFGKLLSGSF